LDFHPPIFDDERDIKNQAGQQTYSLQPQDVPGPGGRHIQQAGGFRFVGYEHIITADNLVDEKNDHQVNIHADNDPSKGFPGGAESLYGGHVNCGGDDQSVRDKGLEEAIVGKP